MQRLRVYLSSTFEDLKDHRVAVFAALERAGVEVARMEAYTAADERPLDLCLNDVARSDIYVGLFAWRYGYVPPASHGNARARSITELEYRQAVDKGLRKLLFFAHADTRAAWPARFRDDMTGDGAAQAALRSELGAEKSVAFFRTPDDLATSVLAALMRSGLTRRVFNVPQRSSMSIYRPAPATEVCEALLGQDDVSGSHVLIHGGGGFGKTTLAVDVCHDPYVLLAFDHAVLWTALGADAVDVAQRLGDLHALVTGSRPTQVAAVDVAHALASALEGRHCLLVVDDVFRAEDLQPFLQLRGVRLLVTTRIRHLSLEAGLQNWHEVQLDEMEAPEAGAVLARGLDADGALRLHLGGLAEKLGCWPLLLDLVNARLLEEARYRSAVDSVANVTTLLKRRGILGFDRSNAASRNAAVSTSVGLTLELAESIRQGLGTRAAECAIFPEDVPIPVVVLASLWNVDVLDAKEDAVRPLDNLSLLKWNRETDEVTLHDSVRLVLRARLVDVPAVHARLVRALGTPAPGTSSYVWRWFGWHCVQAHEQASLRTLLLDLEWLGTALKEAGVTSVLADLERLPDDQEVALIRRACRQSAHMLERAPDQLAAQLLARIPEHHGALRSTISDRAMAQSRPWLRPLAASLADERSRRWLRPMAETLDSVAFSHDGRWAAHAGGSFGGGRRPVVRWNLDKWCLDGPRFETVARRNPFSLAVSADGRWCLYGDSMGCLHRLGPQGFHWQSEENGSLAIALQLALSDDGARGLAGWQSGRLAAWDFEAAREEVLSTESTGQVAALALDPVGRTAIVAWANGRVEHIELWPTRRQELVTLAGKPRALAWAKEASVFAVALEVTVEVRSAQYPQRILCSIMTDRPTALALSGDGRLLAVGTEDGTVAMHRTADAVRVAHHPRGHTYAVSRLAFCWNDKRVVSADMLQIKEWDGEDAQAASASAPMPVARAVKVTGDGERAIAVLEHGGMGVWDLRTGGVRAILPASGVGSAGRESGTRGRWRLQLSANSNRALAWAVDQLIVWNLENGVCVSSHVGAAGEIRAASLSGDGRAVVFIESKDVLLWHPDTGTASVLGSYRGDPPEYVAVSPDGSCAMTSGGDRAVVLWRLIQRPADQMSRLERVQSEQWEMGIRFRRGLAEISTCDIPSRDKPGDLVFANAAEVIVGTGDGSLFRVDVSDPFHPRADLFDGECLNRGRAILVADAGRRVVTAGASALQRWDVGSLELVATFSDVVGTIHAVCTSTRRALLHTPEGIVRLVCLDDGSPVAAFQADKQITNCDADPWLQYLVGVDQGGKLHFLRLESSAP